MIDWRSEYEALAARVVADASRASTLLAGFNTCVDQVYRLDGPALDRLASWDERLAREVVSRIAAGGDGEVFEPAPELRSTLDELVGEPVARQVGGTGVQAAWTLAVLGAPSVVALTDRSPAQLSVLHPAIGLCGATGVVPVAQTVPSGESRKPPHYVLEYTAGTRWRGGTVPRSSRIIVRLADDGIERDEEFARWGTTAGAGLVSGLNSLPEGDDDSRRWLRELVSGWRSAGLPAIHLELAEYPRKGALAEVAGAYAGIVHSLGLSLAELSTLHPGATDPAHAARDLAERYRLERVCVHADTWSLLVHRGDPEPAARAIRTGNLLASARARLGVPADVLDLDATATFAVDRPASRALGGGWRVECAPTPYLSRPTATIGLGDTFVAGLLLAGCLPGTEAAAEAG